MEDREMVYVANPIYQYTPLPNPAQEIRILVLSSYGRTSDSIEILSGLGHKDDQALAVEGLSYEALSYTWEGDQESADKSVKTAVEGRRIHMESCCSGLDGALLPIRPNLAKAIPRFRLSPCYTDDKRCPLDYGRCSRRLWVDAVCINQEDLDERSIQVSSMSRVFANAGRIVVWLGEDSEMGDGELSFAFLRWFWNNRLPRNQLDSKFTAATGRALRSDTLQKFYRRRWFGRLWVVQEVHFARDAIVLCGNSVLPWQALEHGTDFLVSSPSSWKPACYTNLEDLTASLVAGAKATSFGPDILTAMERLHDLRCQDPRDRIGALAAIFGDGIGVDYHKSVKENYRQLAQMLVERGETIRLLRTAVRRRRSAKTSNLEDIDLPSWVPDWRYLGGEYSAHRLPTFVRDLTFHYPGVESSEADGDVLRTFGTYAGFHMKGSEVQHCFAFTATDTGVPKRAPRRTNDHARHQSNPHPATNYPDLADMKDKVTLSFRLVAHTVAGPSRRFSLVVLGKCTSVNTSHYVYASYHQLGSKDITIIGETTI
ncbi:uncharacterized protein LTR77_009980 [Saxophila tyrrhenica]|uniref:Heterokaryon incompatibility domain-containing protein n=1 Tax=Saxophila tyrrhenica TaxID=1690608 RepID=A0AAV9NWK2_9PEZI|nr:hypothetical protein LTR77_009980 [Saxophila tyrrhenica]